MKKKTQEISRREMLAAMAVSSLAGQGTAVPSDVRKASGLPASSILNFGYAQVEAQPQIRCANRRKRAALPHIRRHSRISLAELFRQTPNAHDYCLLLSIRVLVSPGIVRR
ncbi:MAG TPA: hypothetical protein VGJ55_04950 [Pyrinomonadaceae bacterium]|jgi:hypothetical protein